MLEKGKQVFASQGDDGTTTQTVVIEDLQLERFWRTIKYEDVHLQQYQNLGEARAGISRFIQHYNYHRPHQALGYDRPADFYYPRFCCNYGEKIVDIKA